MCATIASVRGASFITFGRGVATRADGAGSGGGTGAGGTSRSLWRGMKRTCKGASSETPTTSGRGVGGRMPNHNDDSRKACSATTTPMASRNRRRSRGGGRRRAWRNCSRVTASSGRNPGGGDVQRWGGTCSGCSITRPRRWQRQGRTPSMRSSREPCVNRDRIRPSGTPSVPPPSHCNLTTRGDRRRLRGRHRRLSAMTAPAAPGRGRP